jgi:hypothetical protein
MERGVALRASPLLEKLGSICSRTRAHHQLTPCWDDISKLILTLSPAAKQAVAVRFDGEF